MKFLKDGGLVEITQDELDALKAEAVKWNKESHLAEINILHKEEFERRYKAHDYDAEWDVVLYAEKPELGYQEEANALLDYWTNGWDAIKAYGETVTEANAKTPEEFLATL